MQDPVLSSPSRSRCPLLLGAVFALAAGASSPPALAQGCADVILIVDSSPSMIDEAEQIEASINTSFAGLIEAAGVDLRLVLITLDSLSPQGICVAPPLGSGNCPDDENLPDYRHVNVPVHSGQLYSQLLATYPSWSSSLRPNASRSLIFITDDDDSVTAQSFHAQLLALDPSFSGYRAHAIVGADYPFGSNCFFQVPDEGTEYIALANQTGGVFWEICPFQDMDIGFLQIVQAIVADSTVPCKFLPDDRVPGDAGTREVSLAPSAAGLTVDLGSPRVGELWTIQVDRRNVSGAHFSVVRGSLRGQAGRLFASRVASSRGLDLHRIPIPDDPSLEGLELLVQVSVLGDRVERDARLVRLGR